MLGQPLTPEIVQRLQQTAGNAATARLLAAVPVQRLTRPAATATPKFRMLTSDIRGKQKHLSAHPPARTEATASQAAAKAPPDDKLAQGKAANAEKMNAAKPGKFDKAGFVRAVNAAIAAQAPANLDEADKFGGSGKAAAVKGQVQGQVGAGKKASAGAIESATKAPPDTAQAKDKPVTPLRPDQPPPAPATPDPGKAVPDAAPASATDFSAGPKQVNDQMAQADVTEQQLAKSNEPEFTGALTAKKKGEQHAATAPGVVRAAERQTLTGARAQAAQAGTAAMTALATNRRQAGAKVTAGKQGAKGRDEARRAQVTARLQKVFDGTKKDVEEILTGLDKKVDTAFTAGEKAARDGFTAEHKRRMDEYKDRRYSGFTGKLRWVKDKFSGLPAEANEIFVQARKGYVDRMQQVISEVADVIGAELNRAKQRIATGRAELKAEVAKLDPDLRAIGNEAANEFAGKFDELTESVDAKGNELVQTLATRYNEALKSVDEEISAEKEKNKGLIAKAVDAVKGVIDTILKLKDMLLNVLARAASAVMAIIKDPIGFLGKLVSAVGSGLRAFLANIGEHLKKGLVGWLMGAMASAGLQLPAKFDLRGIFLMIGSLLGLTWAAIRGRIVSRGVPEQAMGAVEQSVPVVQKLQSEGVGGLWEQIKEKVGDLKANLFGKISEYLIPTVLIAGITWIISLLNPASAFVKACKMIVDIVTFIVERGAQIIQFVNSVLDAIIAIAGGGTGGVGALIENALSRSIPVLIGALAAILGIGGIADKVKKFIQSLAKPVMKAVDWVVDKVVKLGKSIWAKLKGAGRKLRDKFGGKGSDRGGEQGPVTAPRRLVEPAELNVNEINPSLGNELKHARSGQTIYQKGGDPKQVTEQILAQHGDARFDRSSATLTLPKVSGLGQSANLEGVGAQVASQTGVSKVTIEKKQDHAEVFATINPTVKVARITGLPTDEAILRIAIAQKGIVEFLKAMAGGATLSVTQDGVSGTIGLADFEAAWTKQSNVDYIKDKFRDALDGHHEWIPSNYILAVTKRASALAGEGPKWIDLQHELRSETFRIVFSPAMAKPKTVKDTVPGGTAIEEYSVPSGHVGAVYYKGVQQTKGERAFHTSLRGAFERNTTVQATAQAVLALARQWVWDGAAMLPGIHPECRDREGNQVTSASQAAHVTAIEGHFTKFTT
ncbi:MAG TPA: hypothetical protein VGR06_36305 [Actinophytocola sp.]|uniref:hypothetical protein n=1 Tax=Actinophytocola sp. TaxID=1872138 RepID=UPI002E013AC3|nr:hypothetical protein [Actinophytocola sp.]